MKAKQRRYALGTLLIVGSMGVLLASSMKSSALRAVPVGEICSADQTASSYVGQTVRIVGWVGKDPVRRELVKSSSGATYVNHFEVVDKDKKVQVSFSDILPDTFRQGSPVQVDGLYSAAGQMQAHRVLTKCPSKYEAGQGQEETGKSVNGSPLKTSNAQAFNSSASTTTMVQ